MYLDPNYESLLSHLTHEITYKKYSWKKIVELEHFICVVTIHVEKYLYTNMLFNYT